MYVTSEVYLKVRHFLVNFGLCYGIPPGVGQDPHPFLPEETQLVWPPPVQTKGTADGYN